MKRKVFKMRIAHMLMQFRLEHRRLRKMTDNRIIITITKKQITRGVAFGVVILAFIIIALFVKFKIEDAKYYGPVFDFDSGDKYVNQAIEVWDKYGCSYFYNEDQNEALGNFERILEIESVKNYVRSQNTIYGFIHLYSDADIEYALNAIVYGCDDPKHDTGKFKSISDIPDRLFGCCYTQIQVRNNMNYAIDIVYNEFIEELKKADNM